MKLRLNQIGYIIYVCASNKFHLKFMSPGHEYKLLSPSGVKSP